MNNRTIIRKSLKKKRLVLKVVKSAPPIYQSLIVFNDEDHLIPPVIESTLCNVARAYHLHVDYDDEYALQLTDSMIGLDIPPIEQAWRVKDQIKTY